MEWLVLAGVVASFVLAVAGAVDSAGVPNRPKRGIREPPRFVQPLWGRVAFACAVGGTVVASALSTELTVLLLVAFFAAPAWLALPWAPVLPRRRRVRDLLFTLGPVFLAPFLFSLGHLSLYLMILGYFAPTLVATVIAAAAPQAALQVRPGSRGSPPRRRRPVSA